MNPQEPSPLERAWAVLTRPAGDQLTSFPLDTFFDGPPCRVAMDAFGARHLLVPTGHEVVAADPKPAVLGLTVRKLGFDGPAETFVDISCAEIDLFPEFDEVISDVLEDLVRSDRPAFTAVHTVTRWRRLFRSRLVRGLSHQSVLGLFAELSTLMALIEARPDFPVDAWRGPLREPHDFEALSHCLEVKAMGAAADSITVHGLEQLDTHDARTLSLLLVRVVDDPDGQTIDDLVELLRGRVSSRSDLRGRLAAAGWSDSGTPAEDRFTVEEVHRIVVDTATPRLVSGMFTNGAVPGGIANVRYDVDLAALLPLADAAELPVIAREVVQ